MAYPTRVGYTTATTSSSGNTLTFNLSDAGLGTISAGNLLLMYFSTAASGAYLQENTGALAGWYTLQARFGTTGNRAMAMYKIATGSESGSLVVPHYTDGTYGVAAGNDEIAGLIVNIDDWYGTYATGVVSAASQGSGAATNTPPAVTGWNEETLYLVMYGWGAGNDSVSSGPTNYTELVPYTGSGLGGGTAVGAFYRNLTTGSAETPAAITMASSDGATAVTVAIRPAVAAVKKLKLLAHSSAASASSVAGVVFSAPTGGNITGSTKYGEFTGKTFEASLESGQAVLKVPVSDFGGGALTTSDTPVALVRNSTNTTGIVSCTVIEE